MLGAQALAAAGGVPGAAEEEDEDGDEEREDFDEEALARSVADAVLEDEPAPEAAATPET